MIGTSRLVTVARMRDHLAHRKAMAGAKAEHAALLPSSSQRSPSTCASARSITWT